MPKNFWTEVNIKLKRYRKWLAMMTPFISAAASKTISALRPGNIERNTLRFQKANLRMFFANFSKEYAQFFCILKVAFLPREKHGKNKGAITMEKIKLGIIGVGNMGTCHIETTAP